MKECIFFLSSFTWIVRMCISFFLVKVTFLPTPQIPPIPFTVLCKGYSIWNPQGGGLDNFTDKVIRNSFLSKHLQSTLKALGGIGGVIDCKFLHSQNKYPNPLVMLKWIMDNPGICRHPFHQISSWLYPNVWQLQNGKKNMRAIQLSVHVLGQR